MLGGAPPPHPGETPPEKKRCMVGGGGGKVERGNGGEEEGRGWRHFSQPLTSGPGREYAWAPQDCRLSELDVSEMHEPNSVHSQMVVLATPSHTGHEESEKYMYMG